MAEFTSAGQPLDAAAQKLNYGTILELLEIDCTPIGGQVHRICSSRQTTGSVQFLGMFFAPVPYQSEGWAWDGSGNAPRPEVTIADVDGIMLYEAALHQDLVGMKVRRWVTTTELLATGSYYGPEIWRVLKKSEANGQYIKFELGTLLDMASVMVPRRQMLKKDFPALGRSRVG